ncbi:DUF1015 domain-containing protein [Telmatospirillum siberiense]|uniref:DUF1015 domain-containing protein n=1 Tax=Telmatospirillum siberiense TaxID=382514 RepID=A0A2N3PW48_9PROT|nr:DUF1015 family protein [Telmatospirillum siberiense]PKU24620.1 DUF1015 domain-containing protein [Telmatospirillum siberiense]
MSVPLLRPFPGLRPAAAHAAEVAAPPYDVLTSDEARLLAEGKAWSFLHISKPEIDLPAGTDVYSPAVYAKAAENLGRMVAEGVLRRDGAPCFYIYRLEMGDHVQTGIVGGGSVAAYDVNRIRKHEFTRPDKEDDRVRQIDACNAQTGPVLLAHRNSPALAGVVARVVAGAPAYRVEAVDGNVHSLWVVDAAADIEAIVAAFEAMPAVYIADGHHRSAAASRVAAARRAAGAADDSPSQSFLVVSFPIEEMKIFDYNRVVRDLNGLSRDAFLAALASEFTVLPVSGQARPNEPRTIGLYLPGQWYRLGLKNAVPADPVARLDVSLLTDRLLAPVLGIHDLRKDKRIDFVGGKRGLGELEKRVDSGEMAAAFALFATRMEDLVAVADAGQVMPPKSTWFEPKLADGMVSYPLDWS